MGPNHDSRFSRWLLPRVEPLIYARRGLLFLGLLLATLFMGWHAGHLKPDAGFEKQIPYAHPYMKVFRKYQAQFGGANLISVALLRTDGQTIYDPVFTDRLKKLTDAVFFLPGVDRSRLSSLFSPGTVYIEAVEGGLEFGDVVPRDFTATPQMLARVRSNVGKGAQIGRLVSVDETGSLIVAELLERNPDTGEKLDYNRLASLLEDQVRRRIESPDMIEYRLKNSRPPFAPNEVVYRGYTDLGWKLRFANFQAEKRTADDRPIFLKGPELVPTRVANPDYQPGMKVAILGFAKVVGDVSDASAEVVGFFGIAVLLMFGLLWIFSGSPKLALLTLSAALAAVVWELGLLQLAGFGLDPFAILVPFLILSIGVSHGVQYINHWGQAVAVDGLDSLSASKAAFRKLFIPGTVAILTNVIGFAMLAFIKIRIVQEMAINAALGMAAVIITNKLMLPVALSWVKLRNPAAFRAGTARRNRLWEPAWQRLSRFATPRPAMAAIGVSLGLLAWALVHYPHLAIGDLQAGVPELRPDSRYNQDSAAVVSEFRIGTDVMKVMAVAPPYGCVKKPVIQAIDALDESLKETPGVLGVLALPEAGKVIYSALNENAPKWRVLPAREGALAAIFRPIPSTLGIQNGDCSVMPVLVFTGDHRAETIARVIETVKGFQKLNPQLPIRLELASGNLGVMAATNEEIRASELVVIIWVHVTLLVFVWLSYRTIASVVAIITPLVLCSLLTYGFMAVWGIGMKSATLPVAAFGVGIGVDDGIYLWGALVTVLKQPGVKLQEAFAAAFRAAGRGTMFTSLALLLAVSTWLLSGLQFQADMGLLLLFMFFTNLLGALFLMPALAWACAQLRRNAEIS